MHRQQIMFYGQSEGSESILIKLTHHVTERYLQRARYAARFECRE